MSTLKHTPGPWYIVERSNEVAKGLIRPTASIESNKDHIVTIIGQKYGPIVSQEEAANAKLIAAAPDMLQGLLVAKKQLEDAIPCLDDGAMSEAEKINDTLTYLISIINKATK